MLLILSLTPLGPKRGLSEPEFHGGVVYEFRTILVRNVFSVQFSKRTIRYKRAEYNMNPMRQTACLLVNPINVNNFAALFYWTPVGLASDLIMASALHFQSSWLGLDHMSLVGSTVFNCWISFLQRFSVGPPVESSSCFISV